MGVCEHYLYCTALECDCPNKTADVFDRIYGAGAGDELRTTCECCEYNVKYKAACTTCQHHDGEKCQYENNESEGINMVHVGRSHTPESPYRKWRIDHRLTTVRLAEYFGVSQASISMFERGLMRSKRLEEGYRALMDSVAEYELEYGG